MESEIGKVTEETADARYRGQLRKCYGALNGQRIEAGAGDWSA